RFNTRHGLDGHLWQGRFYSCPLDEPHAWAAVRYVECNPLRAGMTERAETYPWSSAAAHCNQRPDPLLAADFPPPGVIEDWAEWLHEGESHEMVNHLRRNTQSGRPFGASAFLSRVEHLLGRSLRPKKRGRKPAHAKS